MNIPQELLFWCPHQGKIIESVGFWSMAIYENYDQSSHIESRSCFPCSPAVLHIYIYIHIDVLFLQRLTTPTTVYFSAKTATWPSLMRWLVPGIPSPAMFPEFWHLKSPCFICIPSSPRMVFMLTVNEYQVTIILIQYILGSTKVWCKLYMTSMGRVRPFSVGRSRAQNMLAVALATQERMRKGGKIHDELDELVILSRKALLVISIRTPKSRPPNRCFHRFWSSKSQRFMDETWWLQDDQAKVRRLEQAAGENRGESLDVYGFLRSPSPSHIMKCNWKKGTNHDGKKCVFLVLCIQTHQHVSNLSGTGMIQSW